MNRKPFACSGKALVADARGCYLLVRRSPACVHNAGKWDLPGGKPAPREGFEHALVREVAEETGLTVVLERVLGAVESEISDKKIADLVIECRIESGSVTLSGEHDQYQWVPREKLAAVDVCPQFAPVLKELAAAAPKPFTFSGKALISDGKGRYLLIRRSAASGHNRCKWDLPGGKVDPGENIDHALIREVAEETGLTISLERVLGAGQSDAPTRKVAYLIMEGRIQSGEITLSSEHDKYQWVARKKLGDIDVCPQFAAFLKTVAQGAAGT